MFENTALPSSEGQAQPSTLFPNLNATQLINRMQYVMSFGDYNIQYDFCLN